MSGSALHRLQRLPAESDPEKMDASFNRTIFSSAIIANILTILDEDDDYWEEVCAMQYDQGYLTDVIPIPRQPCRTRPFSGHQFIGDILNGHPDRGYQHFRMTTTTFIALRDELVGKGLIRGSRNITVDEQLGIFLFCIGHGVANRVLAETFQHSGETISRYFNKVLRGIVMLKDDYITQPTSNTQVHLQISDSINFHPFKNAIGAVDGTHIPAIVKLSEQARFRCRKGFTSQNVMAAVNFDQEFLFVCTGWEGSAADMRVLRWACESGGFTPKENFIWLILGTQTPTDFWRRIEESAIISANLIVTHVVGYIGVRGIFIIIVMPNYIMWWRKHSGY